MAVRPTDMPGVLSTSRRQINVRGELNSSTESAATPVAQFSRLTFTQRPGARRVLGSLIEIDSLPDEIALMQEEDEEAQQEKARLAARANLVHILRQTPGAYKALGIQQLGTSTTDAELLRAFALVDSPPKVLRAAGCKPKEIATIMQLAPVAFLKPRPPKPKSEQEHNHEIVLEEGKWLLIVLGVLAGICIVTSLGLGLTAITKMQKEDGWTHAVCELARFSNGHGNCTGSTCGFDVFIWKDGKRALPERAIRVRNWNLPLHLDEGRASYTVEGDAFHCCNLDKSFQCCGWYDKGDESYCDSWLHKVDESGQPCPKSPWPCRFQESSGAEGGIERLEEVSAVASLWNLGGPAIGLFITGAGIATCIMFASVRLMVSSAGARVRRICGGERAEQIAELEAARVAAIRDPVLRDLEEKKVARSAIKPVRPPPPVNRTFKLPMPAGDAPLQGKEAWQVIDL